MMTEEVSFVLRFIDTIRFEHCRSPAYFMIEHHHYWRALHLGYYVARCVRLDLSDHVNASRWLCAHVENSQLQLRGVLVRI